MIALDLPGFGESLPLPGAAPSVPELARSVARFVDELGVERPHVAGNSLGGAVALELGRMGARALGLRALAGGLRRRGWEAATRSRRCARCGRWPGAGAGGRPAGAQRADAPRHLVAARRAPGARAAG